MPAHQVLGCYVLLRVATSLNIDSFIADSTVPVPHRVQGATSTCRAVWNCFRSVCPAHFPEAAKGELLYVSWYDGDTASCVPRTPRRLLGCEAACMA